MCGTEVSVFHTREGACLRMGEEGGVQRGFRMHDEENQPSKEFNVNALSVAQRAAITDALALISILFAGILSPL